MCTAFLYIIYTSLKLFRKKRNQSFYKGPEGSLQPGPPTNSLVISDYSPAATPACASLSRWIVPGVHTRLRASTCCSFCLQRSSSKYSTTPSGFYSKVSHTAKFTLTTLTKCINTPYFLSTLSCMFFSRVLTIVERHIV